MSSKNDKRWQKLLSFKNQNEKIEHEADMISLRMAVEIEKLIEEKGLTKKEFAQKIGTSAAYVTQVLRGDKRINMKFLAQILQGFDVSFDFGFQEIEETGSPSFDRIFDIARQAEKSLPLCNIYDFTTRKTLKRGHS